MTGVDADSGAHRAFFDNCPQRLLMASSGGAILWWNAAMGDTFGQQITEGRGLAELVHPDDRERMAAAWSGLAGSGQGERLRSCYRWRGKDGSYQAWVLSAAAVPGGEEICVVLLPASVEPASVPAAAWRGSLPSGPLAVVTHDADLQVIDWNDAAQKMFGYSRGQAAGKTFKDLGIAGGPLFDSWREALGRGESVRHACESVTGDGRSIRCRWQSIVVQHAQERRMLSIAQDITDEARLAAEQKEHEMLLRILLDKLPLLVFRVDQRGGITYQDGRGSEALGLEPGQLCGMSLFALYSNRPNDLARVQHALAGQPDHALSEIYGVPWESWYIPCRDERGEVSSMLGISLHMGDLKHAEQQISEKLVTAAEQQRMIRTLSNIIIEVWDDVLTLPLLGLISSELAAQIMTSLLTEVARSQVRYVIVDLTGAGEVDTGTARHVLRLVRAIRLLGTDGIITGIQPEVARTMVSLDVNLSGIRTFANLREGLQFCMRVDKGGG